MTDWLNNLEELNSFFNRPDDFSSDVPDHLAAAAKLLVGFGVTDVFGVGVVGNVEDIEVEEQENGEREEK